MRRFALGCFALLAATTLGHAQNFSTSPCNDHDEGGSSWFGHNARACEIRRTVVPLTGGHLSVTGKNGGIEVIGEDRHDIALEAKVSANGSSQEEAASLLHEVRVITQGDIHADGPGNGSGWSHRSWSVSFKLRVPREVAYAELRTSNGGINVSDIQGELTATSTNGGIMANRIRGGVRVSSTNGGLTLDDLGGTVHAETTNGGVHISLAGDRWHGSELFAKSTNGGVTVKAPERFAAHLVAETVNGGISVAFPIAVQGKIGRHIDTDINGGGPPVHLETTNGGINIEKS